jgi:hypothetical protein
MGWTEKELQKLKKEYQRKTDEELAEELGKSKGEVRGKRRRMGLKKPVGAEWTDDEIRKIEEEYQEKTDEELAEELGKTKGEVRGERRRMGLKKLRSNAKDDWSNKEIEWLKDNYDTMSDKELSLELDKPEHKIQSKRYQLNLKKDYRNGDIYSQQGKIESINRSGSKIQITKSIGTGRKNVLQGRLGEMLADSLRSEAENILELSLDNRWEIFGWKMDVLNPDYETSTVSKGQEPKRKIVPRSSPPIIHRTLDEDEIQNFVENRYVLADKDLLEQYDRVNPPTVDKKYYAVEYAGSSKEIEFEVYDSTNHFSQAEERIEIELPVISDFRILAVEVKTSKSGVRDSLTEAQISALEKAEQSKYLQFYTMSINPENFSIPDRAKIELTRMG